MLTYTCLVFALSAVSAAVAQDATNPLRAVSESSNKFAADLYKSISQEKRENFVMSPLSAHVVLSMAAYGARGSTAKQMRQSLHLPEDDVYGLKGFADLLDQLNNVENVTLEIANNMYLSSTFSVNRDYKRLAASTFKSDASELDFKNSDEAAKVINEWVDEKTHGKVQELVSKDDVDPDTKMVLLNAVYFKGNWAVKFDKKDTIDRAFHIDQKTQIKVPTMFLKSKFVYGELPELRAKFIELPYENTDLKMVIIVPDEIDGLAEIQKNINMFDHNILKLRGYKKEVKLYLPKFKMESELDLKNHLIRLGMNEMFRSNANFKGITEETIFVSTVLQKATIEVNEDGSEAAAATALGIKYLMAMPFIQNVNVDRPFYYRIVENNQNTILFEGACVKP